MKGINTDVWIAPRNMSSQMVNYEWYFMTDEWESMSSVGVQQHLPVLRMNYQDDVNLHLF